MELAIFAIFALLALGSALVVVLHPDPVKSTLALVLALLATAVLFVLLGAPFIGTLQVLIYTGAIVVLFLFVIMLLNLQREVQPEEGNRLQRVVAILGALAFTMLVALALWRTTAGVEPIALTEEFVSLELFSLQLFDRFLLTFELVGLLLLVAVVAAFIIAKRPTGETGPEAGSPAGRSSDASVEGRP